MRKIILYLIDEDKLLRIKQAFLQEDIYIKTIDKTYLDLKLKDIFDDKEPESDKKLSTDEIYDNEFMLLDGFDDEQLKDLIFRFKSNIIARPITSVRTENNQNWVLSELLKEIFIENEYMKNMSK
ncbi:DUF3783 domain-containing protein [Criibacterium bergeronii]|uniref:DUF3783 domain-containing protein n=1 Tax=Criibacterium bergeronii TaxID=1871336 RepID=A0A552V8N9_9FIRM|nr:DUF3783 domain-containing protein [Criibacterium bergeronii]MBS6062551.1 DUF3783 domain-containing protein [Peptostreptococcaceae bacterium]TRW26833.1 DUF3783 domain-containing protein [Criibacterium bergeronii]